MSFDRKSKDGIQTVTKLETDGIFKGFKIISKTKNNTIIYYIINQEKEAIYKNEALDFYFKGAFAVITQDENKKIQDIYIGEGQ